MNILRAAVYRNATHQIQLIKASTSPLSAVASRMSHAKKIQFTDKIDLTHKQPCPSFFAYCDSPTMWLVAISWLVKPSGDVACSKKGHSSIEIRSWSNSMEGNRTFWIFKFWGSNYSVLVYIANLAGGYDGTLSAAVPLMIQPEAEWKERLRWWFRCVRLLTVILKLEFLFFWGENF